MNTDLSSNRCASPLEEYEIPTRHPELCFEDGNLSIVIAGQYFVVHRSVLFRHSQVLRKRIQSISAQDSRLLEGLAVLRLDDSPEDFAFFLRALYGQASPVQNSVNCVSLRFTACPTTPPVISQ